MSETTPPVSSRKNSKRSTDSTSIHSIPSRPSLQSMPEPSGASITQPLKRTSSDQQEKPKTSFWVTRDIADNFGREAVLQSTLIAAYIYAVFLSALAICTLSRTHGMRFYFSEALKGQFINMEFKTINDEDISFEDIRTVNDFWAYTQHQFVDRLYWNLYYDDESLPRPEPEDKKILYENILLGVPRIRQVKVTNDSCKISEYFLLLFNSCYDTYLEKDEDHSDFGKQNGTAWQYQTAEQTGSISFTGLVTTYTGGGFYQDFGTNKEETAAIINDLRDNDWITKGTRAVFIDFTIYNANMNLFAICKLAFEFPATGGVLPSHRFMVVFLDVGFKSPHWISITTECLIYIMGIYYLMEEIREMFFLKLKYFLMFWSYTDLLLIAFIVANLFTSVILFPDVYAKIDNLLKNNNKYGNLENVGALKDANNRICAIQLFFGIIKIFKYLNMNRTLGQLNNTLRNCVYDVACFTVMFMIIFSAYAELGYLLFGSQCVDYSNFGTAMLSLLRTILGDFDYQSIETANRILAPIYFLSYIFLVFFVLLNVFLAIINDKYSDVKTDLVLAPSELQMSEFLLAKFRTRLNKCGIRVGTSEGGEDKTLHLIQQSLKKCGFSQEEIDIFLARFNPNNRLDKGQVVKEIEAQANAAAKIDDSVFVQLVDFLIQEQLSEVQARIQDLIRAFDGPMARLEALEKEYKKD